MIFLKINFKWVLGDGEVIFSEYCWITENTVSLRNVPHHNFKMVCECFFMLTN